MKRIPSEKMLRKFVGKYLADPTFGNLESAAAVQDWKGAFLAAHTLKGVAQNLGFDKLQRSASGLTEALRGDKPLTDMALFQKVREDQKELVEAIGKLDA